MRLADIGCGCWFSLGRAFESVGVESTHRIAPRFCRIAFAARLMGGTNSAKTSVATVTSAYRCRPKIGTSPLALPRKQADLVPRTRHLYLQALQPPRESEQPHERTQSINRGGHSEPDSRLLCNLVVWCVRHSCHVEMLFGRCFSPRPHFSYFFVSRLRKAFNERRRKRLAASERGDRLCLSSAHSLRALATIAHATHKFVCSRSVKTYE
jgi:transposase